MKTITILCCTLIAMVCAANGQALKNAGFESGDLTGWNSFGEGWSVNSKTASEGTNSAMNAILKDVEPGLRGCGQKVKIIPGQKITVSIDVSAIAVKLTPRSEARMLLIFLDAEGKMLKEHKAKAETMKMAYETLSISDAVAPEGAVEAYIVLVVEVIKKAEDGDWWRFDNLKLRVEG